MGLLVVANGARTSEGDMAIISASVDMIAHELDNRIEVAYKEPHDSITEGYYVVKFESVTVYFTKRQLDSLVFLCKEA